MPKTCAGIHGRECSRPVWARGLCSSCYSRMMRYNRIARDFAGPDADRNDYVNLLEAIVQHLLPIAVDYARYISRDTYRKALTHTPEPSFEQSYMYVLLDFLQDALPKTRYNWIVRQINKNMPENIRIPLMRKESMYGPISGGTSPSEPQGTPR